MSVILIWVVKTDINKCHTAPGALLYATRAMTFLSYRLLLPVLWQQQKGGVDAFPSGHYWYLTMNQPDILVNSRFAIIFTQCFLGYSFHYIFWPFFHFWIFVCCLPANQPQTVKGPSLLNPFFLLALEATHIFVCDFVYVYSRTVESESQKWLWAPGVRVGSSYCSWRWWKCSNSDSRTPFLTIKFVVPLMLWGNFLSF